jgi:hypothetical protein
MKKVFLLIAASIVFCSCIKVETPGPQGPRGTQGPAGTPGRDGRDGRDGYGVYINTYYFDVQPNRWNKFGNYGSEGYYCYVDTLLEDLTLSVIEDGAILVYMITEENGQEYDNQLPYLLPFYAGGHFTRIIRYDLQPGKIGFIVEDSDFKTPLLPFNTTIVKFKVVIISKV